MSARRAKKAGRAAVPKPPSDRKAAPAQRRLAAEERKERRAAAKRRDERSLPAQGLSDLRLALLLGLAACLFYNLNFRSITSGDCLPARFLPFAVLEEGSLHLDSVLEATRQGHQATYWILASRDGRTASMYPIVTPLLVTPLYVPAWLYLRNAGWPPEELADMGALMEKLAASVVAAAAVALTFLALRRRMPRREALLLTAIFALGTNTWVIGSQGLWQHGVGELLVAVALLAATGSPSWWNVLVAGGAAGLLAANRPPDLLLALGFALYAPFWARWKTPLFALAAAAPLALTAAYNLWMFGKLTGGYGAVGVVQPFFFSGSVLVGIAGLLVSPGKGLFVFSPFLLFLPVLFRRSLADRPYRTLTLCLAVGVVLQVLLYARTDWRAGYSWGPRFLTDMTPILIWMLAPIVLSLARWPWRVFLAAALFSVAVQTVGAFLYQGRSDILMYLGPGEPKLLAWRPEHTPYWVELSSGFAPMPLLEHFGVGEEMQVPANWF